MVTLLERKTAKAVSAKVMSLYEAVGPIHRALFDLSVTVYGNAVLHQRTPKGKLVCVQC